jgi:hypothetical protein
MFCCALYKMMCPKMTLAAPSLDEPFRSAIQYHSLLIQALSSIPLMQPGDTVFWHSDVVHAVENEHRGSGYSKVMYIGSARAVRRTLPTVKGRRSPSSPGRLRRIFLLIISRSISQVAAQSRI